MPRKIIRPREAQARLGIRHTQFYEIVNAGKLKLVRLGPRSVGVIEEELDRFIDELPDARATAGTS
jgi:predicted DNA-binding transcriptional regulator AlpA